MVLGEFVANYGSAAPPQIVGMLSDPIPALEFRGLANFTRQFHRESPLSFRLHLSIVLFSPRKQRVSMEEQHTDTMLSTTATVVKRSCVSILGAGTQGRRLAFMVSCHWMCY